MKNTRKMFLLGLACTLCLTQTLEAQQRLRLPFQQRSNNQTSLNLNETNGPWLVMCASFRGEEGKAEAKRLALELRQNKFQSYVYSKKFERDEIVQGKDWERYKDANGEFQIRPKRMKHINSSALETAVLVGDFANVDDNRAQKTLEAIKRFHPQKPEEYSAQNLKRWREFSRLLTSDPDSKTQGPYRSAFLMLNPLLPDEYFEAQKVDTFVLQLNSKAKVKHSLLDNPHPYSVRVATFRGGRSLQVNNTSGGGLFNKDKKKSDLGGKLALAAAKANKLTTELRKLGVDAYEFHDRSESYVCVGGFDWIKRGEGPNEVFNPDIAKVIEKFKGKIANVPSMKNAIQPKQLPSLRKTDIVFDVQPMPVSVPKRTASMVNSRRWR